jgi:ribosomal protein S18 acetylase RimI-like enzyme
VTLRPAVPADQAGIAHLERLVFASDAWSEAAVHEELVATDRTVLVAFEAAASAGATGASGSAGASGTPLLGYAVLLRSQGQAGPEAELLRIAVDPRHRRRGTARALLRGVRHEAERAGARRLLLEVAAENAAALGLYRAEGFAELHRRRRYYRDGSDALVMVRPLAPVVRAPTLPGGPDGGGECAP